MGRVNANSNASIQAIANHSVIAGETIHNEPFEIADNAVAGALKAADQRRRAYT